MKFTIPVRHGKKFRDATKLYAVSIGGKDVDPRKIIEESGSVSSDAKLYRWRHIMPPLGKLPVTVSAKVIKEESDSDVWCSFYPCTEGMTLQVVGPSDLRMGIRNNTASKDKMEVNPANGGSGLWKIDGPILPNDSVVFYWRTREHDGDAVVSRGNSSTGPPTRNRTKVEPGVDRVSK